MTAEIREAIRGEALAMGFDAVGFAEAQLANQARADLAEYLGLARPYRGAARRSSDAMAGGAYRRRARAQLRRGG